MVNRLTLGGCAYRTFGGSNIVLLSLDLSPLAAVFLVSDLALRGLVLARGLTQRTSRDGWFFTSGDFLRTRLNRGRRGASKEDSMTS